MNRRAVLLAATALIYAGAVMIAMSEQGWRGFAAIVALLLLYTVLMRPAAQWSGPGLAGVLRLVMTVVVLAAVSGLLWLAGQALSQVAGSMALWPGLVLALGGIALARTVWSGEKQAQMDALLDDALAQLQGFSSTATAIDTPHPPGDDDARWSRLTTVIAQVDPALTLAQARRLAAALAPDLDRELYREAMIDLSERGGAGALRLQLALMARREVMPWWYDAYSALSLLKRALDIDTETAALACDVADYRLSEPDVDLVEATVLLDGIEAHLADLPADDPLHPRLHAILAPLRAAAAALVGREESSAVAALLAELEAGMEDNTLLARLKALPLTEAMPSLLALAERAEQGETMAARALVLHATRPEVVDWLGGLLVPAMAFVRIEGEAALNALFTERANALLAQMPAAAAEMPDPAEIQTRAAKLNLAELARLAAQVNRLRQSCRQPQGQEP